jgi:RNA polymerase sigma-70 factor (ECF subfamily)
MYRVAHNLCVDQLRKLAAERPLPERFEELESEPAVAADAALRSESASLLRRALLALPEEKRAVIVLSRFQELRHEEIGRLLGCTAGAVKVRLHRALKDLRQAYDRVSEVPT